MLSRPGRGRGLFPVSSYTKLFHSILDSSVWQEDDRTRLVWITLLAMADQHGEIQASIPGVAKRAGVPLESAEAAIGKLMAPDRYSRTPDHEGRRIAKIEGGWEILNHAKYRFEASIEDRREKAMERQRRRRNGLQKQEGENITECDKALRSVTHRDTSRSVTLLDDKQKQSQKQSQRETSPKAPKGAEPVGFDEFWKAYPRKAAKPAAIKAWVKLNPNDETFRKILESVKTQAASPDWLKDGGQFIPYPATYLNGRRWEDLFELPETKETLADKLRAHCGNPNHVAHSTATADQRSEFAEMLARYKGMA